MARRDEKGISAAMPNASATAQLVCRDIFSRKYHVFSVPLERPSSLDGDRFQTVRFPQVDSGEQEVSALVFRNAFSSIPRRKAPSECHFRCRAHSLSSAKTCLNAISDGNSGEIQTPFRRLLIWSTLRRSAMPN